MRSTESSEFSSFCVMEVWRPGWSRFTCSTWNWDSLLILVGNNMEAGERESRWLKLCMLQHKSAPRT